MGVTLTRENLAPFADIDEAKANEMIADVLALAVFVAPCLADDDLAPAKAAAAKAVLRGAVLRWDDSGNGAVTTNQAGPFSQTIDGTVRRSGVLWPSEIKQLQEICKSAGPEDGAAFAVSVLAPRPEPVHADICSLRFDLEAGCSCGAWLAGLPIYEQG